MIKLTRKFYINSMQNQNVQFRQFPTRIDIKNKYSLEDTNHVHVGLLYSVVTSIIASRYLIK